MIVRLPLSTGGRRRTFALLCALLLPIGACASLPSSGPTARDIVRTQARLDRFDMIAVDGAVIAGLEGAPARGGGHLADLAQIGPVEAIGPGDVLQVTVYEVGASLFGGRPAATDAVSPSTGSGESLPPVTVGTSGIITLPWIGPLMAAGKTPDQLAAEITSEYAKNSERPQAMVAIRSNVSNTVIVQGAVKDPGRIALTAARERLLDVIAMAGGPDVASFDAMVQLNRGARTVQQPLSDIEPGAPDDLWLLPQDRIAILNRPRTFTVLGAAGRASEFPFQAGRVSLAEAIGRASGLNDALADPAAVFVFRYEPAAHDGTPAGPARAVAYRLSLRDPEGYLLAQRFEIQARDVVYVATADASIPTKAIQILNLFFSPFYTARTLTQ